MSCKAASPDIKPFLLCLLSLLFLGRSMSFACLSCFFFLFRSLSFSSFRSLVSVVVGGFLFFSFLYLVSQPFVC